MMSDPATFCSEPAMNNILYMVGIVVAVIRVAVPIILIVLGMIDLVKALTSQDDKQIKSATNLLVKRVIIAIAIFLIPTIVRLVMNIISQDEYQSCINCVTSVWSKNCTWKN